MMATFIENLCWLAVFSENGDLLADYSEVDISDIPVIDEGDIEENYGIFRQIEWFHATRVVLAWETTSPEGQLRDFAIGAALVIKAVKLMDIPNLTWAPAIVPMFRWNLLPRSLNA